MERKPSFWADRYNLSGYLVQYAKQLKRVTELLYCHITILYHPVYYQGNKIEQDK